MQGGSWEGRMAARAAARRADRDRLARALREFEEAEAGRQLREEFAAGPPGGCGECYVWAADSLAPRYWWAHVAVEGCCRHGCHGGETVWCEPAAYG